MLKHLAIMPEGQEAEPSRSDEAETLAALEARAQASLEWQVLLAALAERATSDPGAARIRCLVPATLIEDAHRRTARVRTLLELRENGVDLPLTGFPDVRSTLARLRLGADAAGEELTELSIMLLQAQKLRKLAEVHGSDFAVLAELLASDPRLDRITLRLSECLEPNGSVADSASALLAEARARVREIREELRKRLQGLVQRYADVLQGQYHTERDGRYVLPVRSDAHYRVEGIVLGSSGSGSTLFVEPGELTELGNRLRVREAAVEREIAKVLAELSGIVRERLPEIARAFEVCVEADVIQALGRWAVETRSRPIAVGNTPNVKLLSARHPLLVSRQEPVIENDISLAKGQALVLSGPNAGGKTVTLKCLGLFAWMARAGIPLPAAAESEIGWFDHVLADVGDEQSLVRSLSTFSAHMRNLASILSYAANGTLVLLDEVAAGTDPEEGAALAASVLEALTARGASVAVTTHYERLKELAAQEGRLENASVGFDFERMLPTYRLTIGVPGASSALAVAARYGLPESVIQRARVLLPHAALDRERAVNELAKQRELAERERRELVELREAAVAAEALREKERAHVEHDARAQIERETRRLVQEVRAARTEIETLRKRLSKEPMDRRALKDVERAVSRIAADAGEGGRLAAPEIGEKPRARGVDPSALLPGARVRLRRTGNIGSVLERPMRGEVRLQLGALRITQKLDEVELISAADASVPKQARRMPRALESAVPGLARALRTRDNTLDLRGVRVEDAAQRIDAFLDRMLGEGQTVGFVLHGHGTGMLRHAVRDHLGSSSYVERFRAAEPDEGGEAFSVFWVR